MMENTVVFLLLLCALSSADMALSEGESRQHPSDIEAVLRNISTVLAEYRVKIEYLQTQNQAQAAEINSIKEKVTENHLEALSRDKVGQVAFSVSFLDSGSGNYGQYNTQVTMVYKHVVTNIGNAYNRQTGIFTAPVRGAYHFEFYFGGFGPSLSAAVLVKNGKPVFAAAEQQTQSFGTAANGASLLLEAGDQVYVNLWQNSVIFDNENHHNTFSGHLLFTI